MTDSNLGRITGVPKRIFRGLLIRWKEMLVLHVYKPPTMG